MSEPMSSVEIEDVLSSIRRLVSEDLRPLHRPHPNPAAFRPLAAERAAAPGADRLILTPALRVVRVPESPTKTVIAALEVAVKERGDPWESETGDEAPAAAPNTSGLGWADDVWDEAVARAIRDRQQAAPAALILESIRTALPDDLAVESAVVAVLPATEPAWDQDSDRETDFAPQLEPEMPQPADPVWVDRAEAEVLAALADDPWRDTAEVFTSRRSVPAAAMAEADDEITFDEEVLRDLVRDLIREELQGALGERITRNVRKLVRAEIARAISAQAYE